MEPVGRHLAEPARLSAGEPARLKGMLSEFVTEMGITVARHTETLSSLDPPRRESAQNLLHYLVLRRRDIRELQRSLSGLGLSSLGRCEHDVKVHVERVIALLDMMTDSGALRPVARTEGYKAPRILEQNAEKLLGPRPSDRAVRVMVTMPSEAASNQRLLDDLIAGGMDLARINTAHGDADAWRKIAENIRDASQRIGRPCRIHLDLAGPKLRTGAIRKGDKLVVGPGDPLVLSSDDRPGEAAVKKDGKVVRPARIGCTQPQMLSSVRVGNALHIDDGKVSARAVECHADHVVFEVERARHGGARIKAEKGLVFPGSPASFPALTHKDREALAAMVDAVDLVGQSFVRRAQDVNDLIETLAGLGRKDIGVVAKIETVQGFEQLPQIVLAGMHADRFGVMIARGDLALEVGFERLAEVQEEILWLCEAGRIPVIWATQVLEGLAKKGVPARGEITDAAMSVRAECVMLNKGPYIRQALASLVDILRRMADHQSKKTAMMRRLSSWNV